MNVTCKFKKNQSLFNCFIEITDPRVAGRCTYTLFTIIVIVLCGLICGCDNWKSIAMMARARKRWLGQWIDLSSGVPSHQTLARAFSLINPFEFEQCLQNWMEEISDVLDGDVIAIDGKTLRGSGHKRGNKKASHVINAYHPRSKCTLASTITPNKSNEIKGIPLLLKAMNIDNKIITIDAMGTQKGIAKLIRMKDAHYVLALKKNHGRMYKKVDNLFKKSDHLEYNAMVFQKTHSKDYDHSRLEVRHYTVLPMMYLHQYKHQWKDLSAFIRVQSQRHLPNGSIEEANRYYITSLPYKKHRKMNQAIREHWRIENSLHFKLDVGMNEDQCQIFSGFADRNLSIMRKIVLKLLSDDTETDAGIALKRMKAALSVRYTKKVIGF